MGTKGRPRPVNLSRKLRQIRIALQLSQAEMVRRLGFGDSFHVGRISEFESNVREPSLLILLAYARIAQVHLEELLGRVAGDLRKRPVDLERTAPILRGDAEQGHADRGVLECAAETELDLADGAVGALPRGDVA